ncbi:MAG: polysaccharide lyase family 7 protein [Polaribacter sp.]|uniref:polysaccharide lyase family 7 protein n=1 Tax=Polaribacter sp. TaxID=1920175 RepID=UPI00321BF43A
MFIKFYFFNKECTFFVLYILFNLTLSYSQNNTINCDIKPGDIEKFNKALVDAKLHYYSNQGKTKLDLKKAEELCYKDYFYTLNGKMILISPGQKSDRIEIRQEKDLDLNAKSAMHFIATFEDVPEERSNKGVTIGQIHNDAKGVKRPLLRVEIAGGNQIRVVVTESYLKNEGDVENDFFTSFEQKDKIECIIEILGDGDELAVGVKNLTKNEARVITYSVGDLWKTMNGNFYFKAGAYTQVSGPKTKVSYEQFKFIYK